jgi:hypothetical protein
LHQLVSKSLIRSFARGVRDEKSADQGGGYCLAAPVARCLSNEKGTAVEAQTKYDMTKDVQDPDLVCIRPL